MRSARWTTPVLWKWGQTDVLDPVDLATPPGFFGDIFIYTENVTAANGTMQQRWRASFDWSVATCGDVTAGALTRSRDVAPVCR